MDGVRTYKVIRTIIAGLMRQAAEVLPDRVEILEPVIPSPHHPFIRGLCVYTRAFIERGRVDGDERTAAKRY